MKLIVCGGRDYEDRTATFAALDAVHAKTPITLLIHGAATGADSLARAWADARGIESLAEPAHWSDLDAPGAIIRKRRDGTAYNARAGPDRNRRMLEHAPDGVLAFPGGSGTADMLQAAREAGVPVWMPYG